MCSLTSIFRSQQWKLLNLKVFSSCLLLFITHALSVKWAPFLRIFGVTFVHVNLCLHTFTCMIVDFGGVGEGRGLFEVFYSCKTMFCGVRKMHGKVFKRSNIVLKCIYPWSISLFCMRKIQCVFPEINHPSHA